MRFLHEVAAVIMVILLSLLLLFVTGCNCKDEEITQSQSPTEIKGKAFMWKISSDTTSVYVLGSVHVARQDIYPLDSVIEDAFSSTDYLVVEVNTNNVSQEYAAQLILQYGTYDNSHGFKESVSEDLYKKIDEEFQKYGIGLFLMDDYKPFVIYNIISQLILESLGYKAEYGIDFYYLDKAEKSNIRILELETLEFQLSALNSIPDEVMIMALEYDIENPETEFYLQELFNAWGDGDAAAMEAIAFEPLADEPGMVTYYYVMYDQRNLNMLKKIEEYLAADETYFIVVGAAHLVGENGLINLLVDKGYEVEQLDNKD